MAQMYLVEAYTFHPYKIEGSYRIIASNYAVAIRRGLEQFRAMDKLRGKKLEKVFASAERLKLLS